MPTEYEPLSGKKSSRKSKKKGKLSPKTRSGIFNKFFRSGKRDGQLKSSSIGSNDEAWLSSEDDALDAEEYFTAGSDALNEGELPRNTVLNVAQHNRCPAIHFRLFDLKDDGGQEGLSLQEDERFPEHEGLDEEEGGAASPYFSPNKVPLTRTSLRTLNHEASHNPLDRAFRDALPERLENAEEYRQSPRDDHFGTTHFSPASFRPTHSFGIIDIESLKERFSAIARKKEDKYQYAVIDPLPSYVHDEPFNPLRSGQRSDPIIGHVVKTGGDNPLIHLRNNSIELPQNNFEKKYQETYKKFQQEATTLLLQQLSIDVTAKNPNVILVAEINQAMISCDKGKLLEKILTAINKQNPPIMVMFNFPSSVKVDKATQKLFDQHEKRIQGLLHPHRLPTRGTRESSIRKRK